MENEHIILFGAGKIGKEALDVIGSGYVYAFCDNSVKNGCLRVNFVDGVDRG